MISLQDTIVLLENINEDANNETQQFWGDFCQSKAISKQAEYFKKGILDLDIPSKKSIIYWYSHDDEFQDYFKCLSSDNNFIKSLYT